jgi:TetR/AcrR family transcriptional regulator
VTAKTKTRAPRQGSREQKILSAARQLFSTRGYDAVSMNTIAARAGVSKANIFHHFSSKEALYIEVLRGACSNFGPLVEAGFAGRGRLGTRLARFSRRHMETLFEDERRTRLVMREVLDNGQRRGHQLAERVFGRNFSQLVEHVRESQRCGDVRRNLDPAIVAGMLLSANVTFFLWHDVIRYLPEVRFADDPERYASQCCDVLVNGIAACSKVAAGAKSGAATRRAAVR